MFAFFLALAVVGVAFALFVLFSGASARDRHNDEWYSVDPIDRSDYD